MIISGLISICRRDTVDPSSATFYEAGLVKRVMEFNLLFGFPGTALRAGLVPLNCIRRTGPF